MPASRNLKNIINGWEVSTYIKIPDEIKAPNSEDIIENCDYDMGMFGEGKCNIDLKSGKLFFLEPYPIVGKYPSIRENGSKIKSITIDKYNFISLKNLFNKKSTLKQIKSIEDKIDEELIELLVYRLFEYIFSKQSDYHFSGNCQFLYKVPNQNVILMEIPIGGSSYIKIDENQKISYTAKSMYEGKLEDISSKYNYLYQGFVEMEKDLSK